MRRGAVLLRRGGPFCHFQKHFPGVLSELALPGANATVSSWRGHGPGEETTVHGGPVTVGLTSGASTPDNLVAAAIARLEAFCA